LNVKEVLEVVVSCSPKNFHELRICEQFLPEDLESFFVSWGKRLPQKQLTLDIITDFFEPIDEEVIEIIEKLCIIKKFESKFYLF